MDQRMLRLILRNPPPKTTRVGAAPPRRVNTTGAVRVRLDRGWTTLSGKSGDARTAGYQRLKRVTGNKTQERLSYF